MYANIKRDINLYAFHMTTHVPPFSNAYQRYEQQRLTCSHKRIYYTSEYRSYDHQICNDDDNDDNSDADLLNYSYKCSDKQL